MLLIFNTWTNFHCFCVKMLIVICQCAPWHLILRLDGPTALLKKKINSKNFKFWKSWNFGTVGINLKNFQNKYLHIYWLKVGTQVLWIFEHNRTSNLCASLGSTQWYNYIHIINRHILKLLFGFKGPHKNHLFLLKSQNSIFLQKQYLPIYSIGGKVKITGSKRKRKRCICTQSSPLISLVRHPCGKVAKPHHI